MFFGSPAGLEDEEFWLSLQHWALDVVEGFENRFVLEDCVIGALNSFQCAMGHYDNDANVCTLMPHILREFF